MSHEMSKHVKMLAIVIDIRFWHNPSETIESCSNLANTIGFEKLH